MSLVDRHAGRIAVLYSESVAACDPVGVADIADRLKVAKITVHKWAERSVDGFPPAKWKRSGVSLWNWPTVEAWARKTGRIKP